VGFVPTKKFLLEDLLLAHCTT